VDEDDRERYVSVIGADELVGMRLVRQIVERDQFGHLSSRL
jgi:hypothetical protein